jgi:hypothetical protein
MLNRGGVQLQVLRVDVIECGFRRFLQASQVGRVEPRQVERDRHIRLPGSPAQPEIAHLVELLPVLVRKDRVDGVGAHLLDLLGKGFGRKFGRLIHDQPPRAGGLAGWALDDVVDQGA